MHRIIHSRFPSKYRREIDWVRRDAIILDQYNSRPSVLRIELHSMRSAINLPGAASSSRTRER